MSDVDAKVKDMLAALDAEEHSLSEALQAIEVRLSRVRAAKTTLAALHGEDPVTFEGSLADAIRSVLMSKDVSFTPLEVRDRVLERGYEFPPGSNQMAAVHGVLKRFHESKIAGTKRLRRRPDEVRYYWHAFKSRLAHGPNSVPETEGEG